MKPVPCIFHDDYIIAAYMRKHLIIEFNVIFDLKLERPLPNKHKDWAIIILTVLLKGIEVLAAFADRIKINLP